MPPKPGRKSCHGETKLTIIVIFLDVTAIVGKYGRIGRYFENVMNATQVSVAQAKAEFAALVSRAEAGEEIIVTRHGKPVARITPLIEHSMVYGDLMGLRLSDDLSLPDSIIDDFMAR